ncbi:protein dispatched homolog 3-like [Dendronephthya gigantea]|uniref:protein dispatched homolog 3-like n=1 Tax=Dendronephthya gigantea TaxID=151771 RepID=UPI00106D98E6|nr:protein dispatched homolog 3-like [Dendronephthya gigantea]
MSGSYPPSETVDSNQETMERIAPNDEVFNAKNITESENELTLPRKEPSWFCKLVVFRPVSVFAVTLGAHVLLLLLTVLLVISGYDILPADFGRVPLNLEKDDTKLRFDAFNFAKYGGAVTAKPPNAGAQHERGITYQTLEFVYELKDANILTKSNLLRMQETENAVLEKEIYKEKLCQLVQSKNGAKTCRPTFSLLRFFDGSYQKMHPDLYDPNFENISRVLMTARALNLTRTYLAYHLGKDVEFDKVNDIVRTSYCRSLLYIGWPLAGYDNVQEKEEKQTESLDEYIFTAFGSSLANLAKEGIGAMNFYYNNRALRRKATQEQVIADMRLAIISFVFIVVFMWLQTGSLWVTGWAIFSILSSFNIANLIYRIILDYRYFGVFHVLSIFIILGIGADDIFVFTDTWKQSEGIEFPSKAHRLDFVYRRAAKAMFITSFTTIVAFLSNAPSPLLAISSFGVFSAVLVFVNYCSVVIFFPAVVIMHETYRIGKCCCCLLTCCKRQTPQPDDSSAQNKRKRLGKYIAEFFEETFFNKVVKHKITRYVVLTLFLVVIIVSIILAIGLEPNEEQVEIWSPDTNWAKVRKLRETKFAASESDRVVKVTIVWGLKNQDRSDCHHTDFKCRGKTIFDTSFDMNSPPCQRSVLNLCEKLRNPSPDISNKLKLRRNQVTGKIEMECFMTRMDEYFKAEGNKSKYTPNSDLSIPSSEQKMTTLMKGNPSRYNMSMHSKDYFRFFEVGLGFFLRNGSQSTFVNNYDYKTYSKYFGSRNDITTSGTYEGLKLQENQYGNSLLFMAVAFNTSLQVAKLGYKAGLPVQDNWEDFVKTEMEEMPPSCNKAFQQTVDGFNIWHWLKVQKILIKNAVQGIVIGLLLALFVLIIATTNVIVGILATFTIAMITCSVLATITLLGWKLGVLESLNMTLVVGLSVDYVVHLAEGYMELEGGNRLRRTKHTLGHVGISVVSGACSTLGASVVMFAGKIIFFIQFGTFIFVTIAFSTLYSLVFFSTVLALVGPEGKHGSILPVVRKMKDIIIGKGKYDVICNQCNGQGYHKRSDLKRDEDGGANEGGLGACDVPNT